MVDGVLKKKNNRNAGHSEGIKTIEKIIKETLKQNINYLTLYTFSTENWKRPKEEINFLFNLLEKFLIRKIKILIQNNIRLKVVGDKTPFSPKIKNLLNKTEKKTKKFDKLQINLALNYGSKKELINAFKRIKKKKIKISEHNISKNLYTKNIPDPDILIRTGNTNRLSNFLLWQLAYTEIFFEKKMWPDFNTNDFNKIINNYHKIIRKFGSINGK